MVNGVCLQDSSDDALRQERNIEVDEKADFLVGQLKVSEQLSVMYREKLFDRLQFQHNFILDDQVDLVATIQLEAFIEHGQVELPLKIQCSKV